MPNNSYKLGSHRITEGFDGHLWWESHHGLGSIQKGRCFIEGNILIIGPSEVEEPGFLKREFLKYLNKFPNWDKTRYYCLSHSIRNCGTGRQIAFENKIKYRVGPTINTVKVPISNLIENKVALKRQPFSTKEFSISKKMIMELCGIAKKSFIWIQGEFFTILKKVTSKYGR